MPGSGAVVGVCYDLTEIRGALPRRYTAPAQTTAPPTTRRQLRTAPKREQNFVPEGSDMSAALPGHDWATAAGRIAWPDSAVCDPTLFATALPAVIRILHVLVKPTDQALRMLPEMIVGIETLIRFLDPQQLLLLSA